MMNLKPCPFCGELPEVEKWSRGVAVVHRDCRAGIDSFSDSPNGGGFGAYGKDEESAIESWNTRAERIVERCEYCSAGNGFDRQRVMMSNHGWQTLYYCPNCGAKVVE